jgi:hypothetical protein
MDKDNKADGAGDYMDRGGAVAVGAVVIGLLVIAGALVLATGPTGEVRICGYVMVVLGLITAIMYGSAEQAAANRARVVRDLTDELEKAQEDGQTYLSEWNLERAAWDQERAAAEASLTRAQDSVVNHRNERDAARQQRNEIAAERDRLRIERDRADALVVRLSDGMRLLNEAALRAQAEAADLVTIAGAIRRRPEEEVKLRELLDFGWAVIANVGNGDWTTENAGWQASAERFSAMYHELTGNPDARPDLPGEVDEDEGADDEDGPPTIESLAARMDTIEADLFGDDVPGLAGRVTALEKRDGGARHLRELAEGLNRPELSHLDPVEIIVDDFKQLKGAVENLRKAARGTDNNMGRAETFLRTRLAVLVGQVRKLATEVEFLFNLRKADGVAPGRRLGPVPLTDDHYDDTIQAHLAALGAVDPSALGPCPTNWPPGECGPCPCPPGCCVARKGAAG